jgi:hypothetical protein
MVWYGTYLNFILFVTCILFMVWYLSELYLVCHLYPIYPPCEYWFLVSFVALFTYVMHPNWFQCGLGHQIDWVIVDLFG